MIKKNLHLATDDKFLDLFIENEEKFTKTENRYIVYLWENELKYTKSKNITLVYEATLEKLLKAVGDLDQYKTIYLHYLTDLLANFVNSLNSNINIVWIFWGADGFHLKKFKDKLYLPLTKKTNSLIDNSSSTIWSKNPITISKNLLKKFIIQNNKFPYEKAAVKAMKRINFFSHYIYEDFTKIKKAYHINSEYIDFNYGTIKQFESTLFLKMNTEKNILLGNSADTANNHIDTLFFIAKCNLSFNKIYCPLSYGGDPQYIDCIIKTGKQLFNEKFIPILEFLTKEKYDEILSRCSIAIYNHSRSQASGNVVSMILGGKKVFMNKSSTLYRLLKNYDIDIFDINTLLSEFEISLTEQQINQNLFQLEQMVGEEAMKQKYNRLLNL